LNFIGKNNLFFSSGVERKLRKIVKENTSINEIGDGRGKLAVN
jgi:hypothetical protein